MSDVLHARKPERLTSTTDLKLRLQLMEQEKEIAQLRTTLGHLEEAFEVLCHSDVHGNTHGEDD